MSHKNNSDELNVEESKLPDCTHSTYCSVFVCIKSYKVI